jgi:glycosyltransferase involved in cell wall biosynthesis
MSKPNILIVSFSNLHSDPRILRQYAALKDSCIIHTCANKPFADSRIPFYPISEQLPFSIPRKIKRLIQFAFQKHDAFYWDDNKKRVANHFKNHNFDVIIANDITTLPLTLKIAGSKAKVLFDAHDYHPQEFEESLRWRLFHQSFIKYLCKKYIPKANVFTTASEGFVNVFEKFTGSKPIVITNAPFYAELSPTSVNPDEIRLVSHGAAIRTRKLELMIEMMTYLDKRFQLDFLLLGDHDYINELKQLAVKFTNIRFLPAVETTEIASFTNSYDLGVYILNPSSLNNLLLSPNKLFEYVQARIGAIVSPNQEMSKFVQQYDVGMVVKDYSPRSMAEVIRNLSVDQIIYFKNQAHKHAMELSAEANLKKINKIVSDLASQ